EVSVEAVLKVMAQNIENTRSILKELFQNYEPKDDCPDQSSLKHAIMTDRSMIPEKTKEKLKLIIGKYV
ncbi:MAG: S-methyl-5'-thioadenosine phosphorylase, partial [Deltaproteobacteria bacterium]|nr:S-methyl-5'-thioadenosine phosphorylase [Deltaproteobacteria bacterium]